MLHNVNILLFGNVELNHLCHIYIYIEVGYAEL